MHQGTNQQKVAQATRGNNFGVMFVQLVQRGMEPVVSCLLILHLCLSFLTSSLNLLTVSSSLGMQKYHNFGLVSATTRTQRNHRIGSLRSAYVEDLTPPKPAKVTGLPFTFTPPSILAAILSNDVRAMHCGIWQFF